jgi:uncharacterized repeat protein (TIGR03803 family)
VGGDNPCSRVTCGTVFSLTPPAAPGAAWTESVYSFFAAASPQGGIAIGRGGAVLYGATNDYMFELRPPAPLGSSWTEGVLLNFGSRGNISPGSPVIGTDGVLYATLNANTDSVFTLTPPASSGGSWTETILHNFGGSGDGAAPEGIALAASGALYGPTFGGGLAGCGSDESCGTVYSLTPPTTTGGLWTETILHRFGSTDGDGANPIGGVVIGTGGTLYGATGYGGGTDDVCGESQGCGTVYSLTPPGSSGGGAYSILHRFTGSVNGDGAGPLSLIAHNGVLYGVTVQGGAACAPTGCGTVFSLTPPASPGGAWTETILYSFTGGNDGGAPTRGLAIDSDGMLYGATEWGGAFGVGTVFSLLP